MNFPERRQGWRPSRRAPTRVSGPTGPAVSKGSLEAQQVLYCRTTDGVQHSSKSQGEETSRPEVSPLFPGEDTRRDGPTSPGFHSHSVSWRGQGPRWTPRCSSIIRMSFSGLKMSMTTNVCIRKKRNRRRCPARGSSQMHCSCIGRVQLLRRMSYVCLTDLGRPPG